MPPARKKNLRLAALLVALAASASLLPLSQRLRQPAPRDTTLAAAPAAAPAGEETPPPPAPPGAEVVPPEESETDRGPAAASPAGPVLSVGRASGLHLTPDPLKLNSSAALLLDPSSGEVLARKNDLAVLPMASLTKLMTTLLVLEAKQPMDEVLTITEEDVDTERHSRSRLKVGTRLTREEALRLALMSSENRAAHALGRGYPGGVPRLVEAMNAKAGQLGMKNTTYVDPTGLSNRNQSTARDLALLMRAASQNPLMREYSTTPSHLAQLNGRTLQYVNSNRLVRNQRAGWDIELQKTGYIVEAGRCLTMLTKVGGHDLIMVLLDADSNGARLGDAERLRRWVSAQWGLPDVVARDKPESTRKVASAKKKKDKAGDGKRKTSVARKDSAKKSASQDVAKAKGKKPAAAQEAKKKDGRVRQTFAATRDGDKS